MLVLIDRNQLDAKQDMYPHELLLCECRFYDFFKQSNVQFMYTIWIIHAIWCDMSAFCFKFCGSLTMLKYFIWLLNRRKSWKAQLSLFLPTSRLHLVIFNFEVVCIFCSYFTTFRLYHQFSSALYMPYCFQKLSIRMKIESLAYHLLLLTTWAGSQPDSETLQHPRFLP